MKREPVAMAQTRQVRVWANVLTKDAFLPSLFDCVVTRKNEIRRIAQSALINVDSHGVVGGL